MRTYGLREHLYQEARKRGIRFFRYSADNKPVVESTDFDGREKLRITLTDKILDIPVSQLYPMNWMKLQEN